MSSENAYTMAERVKIWAREEGFDLAGIAPVQGAARPEVFREWIAAGRHGGMDYLARGLEERLNLPAKFPWAKSVLCVALAYWTEEKGGKELEADGAAAGTGRIARYAWGRDYHKVVEGKLRRVERKIRAAFGESVGGIGGEKLEMRAYCDTGPILERELAARAGLGWIGKHTLLIHPRAGSWFVLGELILSLELAADSAIGDHCGTCRRCIEACPTGAITPHAVDATRCISYHTLENRGEIPAEFHGAMHAAGYVVGCDICQEVCPFNRTPLVAREEEMRAREPAPAVDLRAILAWQEEQWDILTRGRAFRRAKLGMWKRNAGIVGGDG